MIRYLSALTMVLFLFGLNAPSLATTVKSVIKVNREYGGIHMVAVPQEFTVPYPAQRTYVVYPEKINPPHPGAYFKLKLVDDQNQLKENLIVEYLKVKMGDPVNRIVALKSRLITEIGKYSNTAIIGSTDIKIGNYDGVVVNAQNGDFYLSIIGILNSKSQHCLMATINIDPRYSKIKKIDDLRTFMGSAHDILSRLKFGRELM